MNKAEPAAVHQFPLALGVDERTARAHLTVISTRPGAVVEALAEFFHSASEKSVIPQLKRKFVVDSNSSGLTVASFELPFGTKMIIPWRARVKRTR